MIDKKVIQNLVEEKLEQDMFLVDISVSTSNVIRILVDSYEGLTIEKCVKISRHVEHNLDREAEDFELQVSSPGLTESFKVFEQYKKYLNKEVEIVTESDKKLVGKLISAGDDGISIEIAKREKVDGHKKKQLVITEHNLKYEEIKSAKAVISFK